MPFRPSILVTPASKSANASASSSSQPSPSPSPSFNSVSPFGSQTNAVRRASHGVAPLDGLLASSGPSKPRRNSVGDAFSAIDAATTKSQKQVSMRRTLEVVHKLLSEHQVKIAIDMLSNIFNESIFAPVLDLPVNSSEDFSAHMKRLHQAHSDNISELFRTFRSNRDATGYKSEDLGDVIGHKSPATLKQESLDAKRVSCLGACLGFHTPPDLSTDSSSIQGANSLEAALDFSRMSSRSSTADSQPEAKLRMPSRSLPGSMCVPVGGGSSNSSPLHSPPTSPSTSMQLNVLGSHSRSAAGAMQPGHPKLAVVADTDVEEDGLNDGRRQSLASIGSMKSEIHVDGESKDLTASKRDSKDSCKSQARKSVQWNAKTEQVHFISTGSSEASTSGCEVNPEVPDTRAAPTLLPVSPADPPGNTIPIAPPHSLPPELKAALPSTLEGPSSAKQDLTTSFGESADDGNPMLFRIESERRDVSDTVGQEMPSTSQVRFAEIQQSLSMGRAITGNSQSSDESRESMESVNESSDAFSVNELAYSSSFVPSEGKNSSEASHLVIPTDKSQASKNRESRHSVKYYMGRRGTIHAKIHPAILTGPRWMQKDPGGPGAYFLKNETMQEDQALYLSAPSHRFIIHPSSAFRMSWDLVALVIIVMESVTLPLGLCFELYPPDTVMWLSTVFFTPDIFLNLFTGFYHNGLLILKQHIIIRRYLLGWFCIDFLSTVPWEVVLQSQNQEDESAHATFMLKFAKIGKLMRVLRLLRILKLKSLLQRVEDMFSSYIVLFTLSIAKSITIYVLFCHWTACAWGWLGDYQGTATPYDRANCEPDGPCEHGLGVNNSPWRRRYGLTTDPAASQYLVALQFSTALLTGAELQLMPGLNLERLFVTSMMIVSFLSCSMIISQIVVIMEKISKDNSEYLEQTRIIRDFMVSRDFPLRLQMKVKRYLEYQFKSRKVIHDINSDIMMKVSPFLRVEIQEHMNKAILECHPFFAGMDATVISQVCCLATSILYAPGDVVMRKGQLIHSILFIVRGQLMIKDAREGFSIYMRAPAWTGDRSLFIDMCTPFTVISVLHSEVLTIKQQDLVDLIHEYQYAQEYIKEYYARVTANDPSVFFCHYCRAEGHDIDDCDELTETVCLSCNEVPDMVKMPSTGGFGMLGAVKNMRKNMLGKSPSFGFRPNGGPGLESHTPPNSPQDKTTDKTQAPAKDNYLWNDTG